MKKIGDESKHKGRRLLPRPIRRWKDNIKADRRIQNECRQHSGGSRLATMACSYGCTSETMGLIKLLVFYELSNCQFFKGDLIQ
jgi:hypothetical protein